MKFDLKDSVKYGVPGVIAAAGTWAAIKIAQKRGKSKLLYGALAGILLFAGSYYGMPLDGLLNEKHEETKPNLATENKNNEIKIAA